MTVVIDSGIWISAIHFGGVPAEALELVIQMDDLRILEQKFKRDPETIRTRIAPFWNGAIRVRLPAFPEIPAMIS